MTLIDFKAAQKWRNLPSAMKKKLLDNVFCINCGIATITDYTMTNDPEGIVLEATCNKCGSEVARVIEIE